MFLLSPAESRARDRRASAIVGLLLAVAPTLPAQVTVQDSTGAPVPFAVLESAQGRRVVADAQGVARSARAADGPWLARRIGYRPARGESGAERIVLARLPAALPAVRVASFTTCTAEQVAARGPAELVDAVRALVTELHERRVLHAETRPSVPFRFVTELVAEDGQVLEGEDAVIPLPVAPANRAYVPGRAIERDDDGEWTVRRPRLLDLASAPFLDAHCLLIDDSVDDSTTVLRFLHQVGRPGPQVNGAYVIDRRSGRLRSDTLDYVQPPRGAPGRARFVSTYASVDEQLDPVPIPVRLVEEVEPDDLRVSFDGRRLRIRKTVRTFTRAASP